MRREPWQRDGRRPYNGLEREVQQHPDKTFVGRISRGFDFLGYRFSAAGLVGVAMQMVERCVERMNRLCEQGADKVRIGDYVRRWWKWGGRPGVSGRQTFARRRRR